MKIPLVILLVAFGISSTALARDWHSDRYHKRVKRVCDKRVNDRGWAAGHSAFAREANGLHCGWSYRGSSAKIAKTRALIACRKNATTPCRVFFVLN